MIQVALDMKKAEDALRIANMLFNFNIRLEAGTPLIKSEGMRAVSLLKVYGRPVVADLKTMDTGYLETEMAALSGANYVTVLGAAPDETIAAALDAGDDYGVEVIADLIGVKNIERRAEEVVSLGVKEILVHVGIDQQKKLSPVDIASQLKGVAKRLAVAGGLNPERAEKLKGVADVFVVGGYITKSGNPAAALRRIMEVVGWE